MFSAFAMSSHVMLVLIEQEWVGPLCVEIFFVTRIFLDTAEYVRDEVVAIPWFVVAYNELW